MVGGRGKDAEKVTLTVTHTFIPLFTFSVNRQTIQLVNTQDGRRMEAGYKAGERESRCKQRIKQRKEILNNMYLESLTILKKCYQEVRNGKSCPDPNAKQFLL